MPNPATAEISRASLRIRLARLRSHFWRFQTLSLANRLFANTEQPFLLTRRLFGQLACVDVSRGNPQRLLYLEGERFLAERNLLRRFLRPGQRVVDVGANIGYYLLLFEKLIGPGGSVLCFEPEPENLTELERNVRVNRYANVRVFPAAVGAEDGETALRAGINGTVAEDGTGDFTVPLLRLDSALDDRVDFMKIDVEGYEGHVLAGARRILDRDRPALFVEIHPGFLAPPTTVDGLFAELRKTHDAIELWEIASPGGILGKIQARYLGRGARRIRDTESLLAECRAGRRQEPFWAVAPGSQPR
jgi:FkbM family methyltransferase